MDIDVSGWILEFLLRQNSVDDRTLKDLITVLPLPNNNPRFKKTLILRKLESDIDKGAISERTMEYLELIEELDHNEGGLEVSEPMKAAYCTVAMYCTAKMVEEIVGDEEVKYGTVVERLWSDRVGGMERCGVGLVYGDLVRWVRDVEAGVSDVDVCDNVVKGFMDLDVVETVRRYVDEAKEKMGPSFLELACEAVLSDVGLSEAMGLEGVAEFRSGLTDDHGDEALMTHEDEVSTLNNQSKYSAPTDDAGANSKGNESSKAHVPPTHKYDYIPSPEVSKVQKALEQSSFELHAAVTDPLPDALRLAESLKVSTGGENEAHDFVGGNFTCVNDKAPSSSHDRKGKALETDGDGDTATDQNKRIKPSLFERNHTAHTTEWSDSMDSSEEGSPTRPHLPSPPKRDVSPLSVYKMEKLVRQRKKKRWSVLEEDTLRTGVQKYGKGNWKLILSMYRDIFEDRTEVDLKDKWRNLTR